MKIEPTPELMFWGKKREKKEMCWLNSQFIWSWCDECLSGINHFKWNKRERDSSISKAFPLTNANSFTEPPFPHHTLSRGRAPLEQQNTTQQIDGRHNFPLILSVKMSNYGERRVIVREMERVNRFTWIISLDWCTIPLSDWFRRNNNQPMNLSKAAQLHKNNCS